MHGGEKNLRYFKLRVYVVDIVFLLEMFLLEMLSKKII